LRNDFDEIDDVGSDPLDSFWLIAQIGLPYEILGINKRVGDDMIFG
jgi:hypothetical protein